mmetsp:Transcript_58619/g.69931  ORF Transcript_58619/g.69931 Transcript_58619/m.69931 type:complete len:87 (+) Transcript_58619:984-1244(+)
MSMFLIEVVAILNKIDSRCASLNSLFSFLLSFMDYACLKQNMNFAFVARLQGSRVEFTLFTTNIVTLTITTQFIHTMEQNRKGVRV